MLLFEILLKNEADVYHNRNSGGGGYVLSKEALRRLYHHGNDPSVCRQDDGYEDVELGGCMEKLGVKTVNCSDALGRSRFHSLPPWQTLSAPPMQLLAGKNSDEHFKKFFKTLNEKYLPGGVKWVSKKCKLLEIGRK